METHRLKLDTRATRDRAAFSATLWRASAVALELGFFEGGAVLDLTGVTSITLRVRSARLAEAVLLEKTVAAAAFTSCTVPQWTAGTHEHVRLELTSAETNITIGFKNAVLHVTVSAQLSTGSVQVLGMGEINLVDANAVSGDVSPGAGTAVTLEECNALFVSRAVQSLSGAEKLQVLTNLGLAWLNGATLSGGKITLSTGQTIFVEAAP